MVKIGILFEEKKFKMSKFSIMMHMHNKQRKEGQMIRVPQMAKKYCGKKYFNFRHFKYANCLWIYGILKLY